MGMGRGYGPPPKIFSLMAMPAIRAWTTPPRMTWWKKAVTKTLDWVDEDVD